MTEKLERMDEKMGGFSYYWEEQGERRGKRQGKRLGKLEQLVLQILKKRDLGQTEARIAEDLLEDQKTVSRVFTMAEGQTFSDEVVSNIAETLFAERSVNRGRKKDIECLAGVGADA